MTKKIIKNFIFISSFFSFLILFFSCKSSNHNDFDYVKLSSYKAEPYFQFNSDNFFERKLSNGIPIIIKKSKYQKDAALSIVISSDNTVNNISKSGIEKVTFELIKKASKTYSENYLSSMEFASSSRIKYKIHNDFYEYFLVSQKKDFFDSVPVLTDTFLHPLLNLLDFENILTAEKNENSTMSNNYTSLENLYSFLNKQDSYFSYPFFNEFSNFNLKNIVNFHKSLVNSNRIAIFCSGNFTDLEITELYKIIDDSLGKITQKKFEKKVAVKTKIDFSKFYSLESEQKNKSNFLIPFNIPVYGSKEFFTYGLLSIMLDDLLLEFVKDNHDIIEDAGLGIIRGKINIGLISVINGQKAQLSSEIKDYILASLTDEYILKEMEKYKRIYNSVFISSEKSAEKIINNMALSYIYNNDSKDFIKYPFYIRSIELDDIKKIISSFDFNM